MSGSGSPATSSAPTIYQVIFSWWNLQKKLLNFDSKNFPALLNPPSRRPDRPPRCPWLGHFEATGSKRLGSIAGKDQKEEQRLSGPRDSGFVIRFFLEVWCTKYMSFVQDINWINYRLTECLSGTWMKQSSCSTPSSLAPLQQSKHINVILMLVQGWQRWCIAMTIPHCWHMCKEVSKHS